MIQALSNRFRQPIAAGLSFVFYLQFVSPLYTMGAGRNSGRYGAPAALNRMAGFATTSEGPGAGNRDKKDKAMVKAQSAGPFLHTRPAIGGPGSPEASSFKAAGSDNLVNLFTGDFSYNIPLLDVGGYPVNLFYNGGIGMEQEASWTGLGWNINPGSVSRNVRGVPDDFDGTDTLVQIQNVKPNRTWGGEIGIDGEVLGFKTPNLNFNLGFSNNNYLGPEVDLGAGISVSIPLTKTIIHEKSAPLDTLQGLNLSLGLNAKLSSRSGLTLSPSLNASLHSVSMMTDLGVGLSTSYNGRTGIKDLNISSQMTLFKYSAITNEKGEVHYDRNNIHQGLSSSTISFARPSYLPTLRMPMQYTNSSGQLELGAGMFGLRGAGTVQGYYSVSKVADGSTTLYKPMVGFLFLENGRGHKNAVMDFNRLNDGEVTPNTPILSAPQYDYDVFNIQGEGTGGSIRAYRGDLGFMRDQETLSRDNNISIGFDIAPPGHFGGNWNTVSTPTRSGGWDDNNNTLNQTLVFGGTQNNSSFENVYFRNPGESTVTNDNMINKVGQDNLVRFKLSGSAVSPRLESQLEQFSKHTRGALGTLPLANANASQQRDKRTQVITMLTASDARKIGLDTTLKSYQSTLDAGNNLQFNAIPRVGGYRKGHHISEIDVLEQSGMRYVYGLPVYNTVQKDFTFSVTRQPDINNLVPYDSTNEPTVNSASITGNTGVDGYTSTQQTPAYASSFLITGLLSADYVDVTGNGITEDDLGSAVKFNYSMSPSIHKWRTPRSNTSSITAHFNAGLKSERRDNKAGISYGEREAWYMHSIESKSMIAIFMTSGRSDAKGVFSAMAGNADSSEHTNQKLDSILLYTKADIKAHGLAGALPLKTVHFDYTYSLCAGTPDNPGGGGKLTLADIYVTFNGQSRNSKNMYVFNYGNLPFSFDNPAYGLNASDRWGTYKPAKDSAGNAVNPNGLNNIDYPYTSTSKPVDDEYAGAWSLKKILLPSGGQLEVQYEADDYAYVQNRRACNLYNIYGLGTSPNYTQGKMLYTIYGNQDQNYVYIQLPAALQNTDPVKARQEIYNKYLEGIKQLAFRLNINMPKGMEPLTVYANYGDWGLCPNSTGNNIIYIQLLPINGNGPLANASVQFLINSLPGQAFPGYDMSDNTSISGFLALIGDALGSLGTAFTNAVGQVRSDGKGSSISLANSFIRLNAPTFFKYGGGHRVKRVLLKDNWVAMSGQYASQYGQDYDYTTTAMINGAPTTISSGVASYEPGIGSEENPFREILQFQDKLPLASAQYGAIEMPVLEALYPAPLVGYSKVTVRSINRNGTQGSSVLRSAIGKQVTEFYTAKDYPSFSTYTPMSNMDYHRNPPFTFLYKETIDKRTTSQGFLVETNDMHGKMRSQSAYSESDGNTPLSYTLHTYKNTGANGLNDKVDFVHNELSGNVTSGNMGVDIELMTDVREFSAISNGLNGQIQTDFFTFVPWPIFGIFMYPIQSYTENKYRAVTTTKLINYHAIEDSVIVNDKGSVISTKTIAYDAETGVPVVTKTANEFNDPVYQVSYPAHWAYSGLSPAYKNIGMQFSGVNITDGKIVSGVADLSVFESGDELYVTAGANSPGGTCIPESPTVNKLWVFDTNKNSTALTVPPALRTVSLEIMDSVGRLYTKANTSFRIGRSGKRNSLGLTVSSASCLQNPIQTINGIRQLLLNSADSVVAASAMAFKEKWQTDNDAILKTSTTFVNCAPVESVDCNGSLEKHINPYVKGLVGNFLPYRSYTYYGARKETDPTDNTRIRKNGIINGFGNYWGFDGNSNLVPDNTNTNWVWNSELTKVNARGQELETKNALNIFTAAQYGYSKTLPVAVTNNSPYYQTVYEGFEDFGYQQGISNSPVNPCPFRQLDFSAMTNSHLVNTDTTTFAAHTGKFCLALNHNSTGTVSVPIVASDLPNYNLAFGSTTTQVLNTPGVNFTQSPSSTSDPNYTPTTMGVGLVGSSVSTLVDATPNNSIHHFGASWDGYIQIATKGTYNFTAGVSSNYGIDGNTQTFSNGITVNVSGLDGTPFGTTQQASANSTNQGQSNSYSILLCPGIYHIVGSGSTTYASSSPSSATDVQYQWSCSNCNSNMYQNHNTTNGCTSTLPIAGDPAMLNPSFSMPASQQMLFSAWVRDGQAPTSSGVTDTAVTYYNSQLSIFDGSQNLTPLRPQGPVIDGWQRYEAPFTPAASGSVSLNFVNSGPNTLYIDDIRLHPFNADMKGYVYDPRTLRLSAELDENNYASFYDYDEEGQLIRVKKETIQGIKTIKETRNAKQKTITTLQ